MNKYIGRIFCCSILIITVSCGNTDKDGIFTVVSDGNNWTNLTARLQYKTVAVDTCAKYTPQYFCVGIEVNTYADKHYEDFIRFTILYKEIYDAVKEVSPDTKVFVSFQLERMKGLGETTLSRYSTPAAQWEILSFFDDKLDIIAFTTYPEIEYAIPADIPSDYYSSIKSNFPAALSDRKIAFTETGWNSSVSPNKLCSNTPASQVDYIDKFANLTNSMKDSSEIEFVAWAFMHDMPETTSFDPFRTIGLRNSNGTDKCAAPNAWSQWINYKTFIASAYKIGIGPIPRNFPGVTADWEDMYSNVPLLGSLVLAQTDWRDSAAAAGQIPALFDTLNNAAVKAYTGSTIPIYGIGFFDLSTGDAIINK